jgi:glucosamine-6-phosphate deaminase
MIREYFDKNGKPITKEEVQQLSPEELEIRSGIHINILSDYERLYDAVAEMMVKFMEQRKGKKTTMILPVGPTQQYPVFAKKINERRISLQNLFTFNMDEFLDRNGRTIPESHPMSFKGDMMRDFYDLIDPDLRMPIEQMHFPRHDNYDEINRAFDRHAPDGVDLCLVSVGPEGHIAFDEDPNFNHVEVTEEEFLADRTRLVLVKTSTVDMDALVAGCGDRSAIPPFAVTIGPHDILRAKRAEAVFFAGRWHRTPLRETLFRKPTMHFPGSLLKIRKNPDGSLTKQNINIWTTPVEAGNIFSKTMS